jgi:2-(1,2-epoxy-1,2-dihydrophenyl)acetyl-CoA isomerase
MSTTRERGCDVLRSNPAPGAAQLTFSRPTVKNALRRQTWDDLLAALATCAADRSVRVLVLAGSGGAFSSGADLRDPTPRGDGTLAAMRVVNAAVRTLHEFPKPTVAMVEGVAAGGGASLALGCDFVVADPSAVFKIVFTRRCLTLDCGASWPLPRLVGLRRATELALLGGDITAEDAVAAGLINELVDGGRLRSTVLELAERLAALPGEAVALTKSLLHMSVKPPMVEALEDELRCQSYALVSKDFREAVRSFIERRDPVWTT